MSNDTVLCKYMPYKFFSKMLEESALTLVDPFQCWEDAYEGAFYRAVNDDTAFDYLVKVTHHQMDTPEQIKQLKELLQTVTQVKAQSWTRRDDDLLMWAAYSYSRKAIMIRTKRSSLQKICNDNQIDNTDKLSLLYVEDIQYKFDGPNSIRNYVIYTFDHIEKPSIQPYEAFMYKRKDLSYEQETRVFAFDFKWDKRKTAKLQINDLQSFIDGVMVHPAASKVFTGKVRNLCEKHGITFLGESKKYDTSFLKLRPERL